MTVRTIIPSKVRHPINRDVSSRLREENSRLKADISRLRIEKAQLREINSQLKRENSQLKDELHFTHQELQDEREISDNKDIDMARENALFQMMEEEYLRVNWE